MMEIHIPEITIVEKDVTISIVDKVTKDGFRYDIDIVFGPKDANILEGYIRTIPKIIDGSPVYFSGPCIFNIKKSRFYVPEKAITFPPLTNSSRPQILHIRNAELLQ